MIDEHTLRQTMCRLARSMFERGLTSGSSGNLSARLDDGYLMTPTNSCLGFLEPSQLSKLDAKGRYICGDKPTKEVPLHLSYYEARPQAGAIVHLHSTYATALSCLKHNDQSDALPATTPYLLMRVGRVPVLPYTDPGSADVRPYILEAAPHHSAVLLANHGPVVTGANFESAVYAAEELEETAKLYFVLKDHTFNLLTPEVVERLLSNWTN